VDYKINYSAIKTAIPIERAAKLLNLEVHQEKTQLRGPCPACQHDDPRILALTPGKNLFFCRAAETGGSVIDLAAHILGVKFHDAAEWLQETMPHTRDDHSAPSPARQEPPAAAKAKGGDKTAPPFDPAAFGAKLTYSDEVAALGYTEEDAERFSIGFYKGNVYRPLRYPNGTISHFEGYDPKTGKIKVPDPKRWLPDVPSNVVKLKRA